MFGEILIQWPGTSALLKFDMQYIKYERLCLTKFPYTEKRVENTTCSGEFLTSFEVFGNTVFSADISTEKLKIVKIYSEI